MIGPNVYIISFTEFAKILVPRFIRQPKTLAWLNALLAPLRSLYSQFYAFKEAVIYDTEHDGSVVSLEKVLNDAFDPSDRGIYILNADVIDTDHYYDVSDDYDYDNEDSYIYDPEVFNNNGIDFTVYVPGELQPETEAEITTLQIQIRAKVDKFKFAGLNYNILWLN